MQLTTSWQSISSAGLITNVTISVEGRYTSQSKEGNYTDTEFRIVNYASHSTEWRTTSGTVNFTGAFTDSGSAATYPNYVSNGTVLLTISKRIYHGDDGNKSISLGGHVDAVMGGTRYNANPAQTTVTMPKIDRYPMLTGSTDFTDEGNPVITYTKVLGFSGATVQASIASSDGNTIIVPYRDVTVSDGTYTFNLSQSERNALLAATPNSNTLGVQFKLRTSTTGGTNYFSTRNNTMTVVNANPVVGDNDYTKAEQNAAVATVLDSSDASKVVQNASVVQYTITPVMPKAGTTIASVAVRHNNKDIPVTKSGNSYIADVPIETQTIDIYVKDARGNPTNNAVTKTITIANADFINYAPVKLNEYSFRRANATSSDIKINLDATYWGVTFRTGVTNEPKVYYKKGTASFTLIPSTDYTIDSTNHKLTITNYLLQGDLPYTDPATYTIRIEDLISEAQNTYSVTKGIPTFDAGQFDFKVNGELYIATRAGTSATEIRDLIYPVGSIYLSVNNTNPSALFGGTWVAFGTGRTLVGVDTAQTEFNSVEKTGGHKAMQQHSHTIDSATLTGSTANLLYDDYNPVIAASGIFSIGNSQGANTRSWSGSTGSNAFRTLNVNASHSHSMQNAGTGDSGNLQPYITCYMWKRTA